ARARKAPVLAEIECVACASDLESALALALRAAVERPSAPIGWVATDLNGEPQRVDAWEKARGALLPELGDEAVCWALTLLGDVGASTGALLLGAAAIAIARGDAQDRALVVCSSEGGSCAAAVLSKKIG